MPDEVLTVKVIRDAIAKLRDNMPRPACPHLIHPRYAGPGWERVFDYRDADVVMPCAYLCGTALAFREVSR